ncbi:UNVERIFIED_ORG: acyl-CoA hydrolase [Peribacillus simplex]
MEIIREYLKSGKRKIAVTALLTFVALDQHNRPTRVPQVTPETEEERKLHETAPDRARKRKERDQKRKEMDAFLTTKYPGDRYSSC